MARIKGKNVVYLITYFIYLVAGAYAVFGLLWYTLPYDIVRLVTWDRVITHNSGEMIFPLLAWVLMVVTAATLALLGRAVRGRRVRIACVSGLFVCYAVLLLYMRVPKGTVQDVLLSVNAFAFLLLFVVFGVYAMKFFIVRSRA